MKIIIKALLSILLIVSVTSCKKDKQKFNVRYEIETEEPGYVKVEWTTADGGLSGGHLNVINWPNQDNIWSYGYTGTEGLNILFTGVSSNLYWKVKIRLYIDGELKQSAESSYDVKAKIQYEL